MLRAEPHQRRAYQSYQEGLVAVGGYQVTASDDMCEVSSFTKARGTQGGTASAA